MTNRQVFLQCHYFQKQWPDAAPIEKAQKTIEGLVQALPGCTNSTMLVNCDHMDDSKNSVFLKQYSIKNVRFVFIEHTNANSLGFAFGILTIEEKKRADYHILLHQYFPVGESDDVHATYSFEHNPYELGERLIAYGALRYFISNANKLLLFR